MAGRKYICADCGFTAWCASNIPCINCGSKDFKPTLKKPLTPIKCVECGAVFTPNKHNRIVCSAECKIVRDRRIEVDLKRKTPAFAECKYCGVVFRKRTAQHATCDDARCQDKKKRDKKLRDVGMEEDNELLGPAYPDMPKRKCHTCGKPTYDYWCDKCRGHYRAYNGVTGLSGTCELFAGALIDDGRV